MNEEPIMEENISANRRIRQTAWMVVVMVVTFLLGIGSGYLTWGRDETVALKQEKELAQLHEQVNPADGYTLLVSYGNFGPKLVEAGVIDLNAFKNVMTASGDTLSDAQLDILNKGSEQPIVISAENAHFLLNFFWAVGLANKNPVLIQGPMVQNSAGRIDQFASTGGWTLASKPISELYASMELIPLTAEQQARVEEVAAAVYRPCCNNATLFPDCNHGMAMLGLLELMASRGATLDQMFEAAKYVNAYWFPQQTLEIALYLHAKEGTDFVAAEARRVVGKDFSSASGAGRVHETLLAEGLLKQASDQGGGCTN
jgi:hypothetical protein